MFDSLRNLRKSEGEKRQEELTAYVDDALTPAESRRFEQRLADDSLLRTELQRQQMVTRAIKQLPRVRAPRNFTLSPAEYGRPRSQPIFQLYPALRTATVLAAVFLIVAISADFFTGAGSQPSLNVASAPEGEQALEFAAEPAEQVEAEAIVREVETDDAALESAAEEAPLEEPAEEEMVAYPSELLPEVAEATLAAIPTAADLAEVKPQAPAAGEGAADSAAAIATTGPGRAVQVTATPTVGIEDTVANATSVASSQVTDETLPEETVASQDEIGGAGLSLLRFVEIGLLLAVILLAAATLALRSRL